MSSCVRIPAYDPRDDAWADAWLAFGQRCTPEERARMAKGIDLDMPDHEVAAVAGVSVRTLYRWPKYREFKLVASGRRVHSPRRHNRRRMSPPTDQGFSNPNRSDA